MSAINPWTKPMFKKAGGRTRLTLERRRDKRDVDTEELKEKRKVRTRDRACRFPLCGCRKFRLRLEVSHSQHKGTNGLATKRQLSVAELMVLLCKHRHQDGAISIHHRTLRHGFLSRAKFNGPIAWEVDIAALEYALDVDRHRLTPRPRWRVVAMESSVGVWLPFTDWQREALEQLATMEV